MTPRSGRPLVVTAFAVASCLAHAGCEPATDAGGAGAPGGGPLAHLVEPGAAEGLNVLLITLDTTRPDHLGCYGYENARTPNLDALAGRGVLFENAVTSAPITLPAHASLLTGRYPLALGVRDNGAYRLGPEHVTLAETLAQRGYVTAAFVSAFVLDERFGVNQGFEVYDFDVPDRPGFRRNPNQLRHERPADQVTDAALAWLDRAAGDPAPFFCWVHYFDPHHPYASPLGRPGQTMAEAYDSEIAYMDQELGRLIAALDRSGVRDRTLIVVASDHGEALLEHKESYHGIFVYDSTIRVALMLSCPALFEAPARVGPETVVGLVDVMPTIEDLLGLPVTSPIDGRSLVSARVEPGRAIYIESYHPAETLGCSALHGLRRAADKYIQAPIPEYYDLAADPGELENLFEADVAAPDELRGALATLMDRLDAVQTASSARAVTEDEQRKLAALGYAGTSYGAGVGNRPDPKERIDLINRLIEVRRLEAIGRIDDAIALAAEMAGACDGYDAPVHQLAHLHAARGDDALAIATLDEYARRHPSTDIFHHLATRLKGQKRYEEFERAIAAAELVDTDGRGSIPMLLGDSYAERERYAEALEQYERAKAMDPLRLGGEIDEKIAATREKLDRDG